MRPQLVAWLRDNYPQDAPSDVFNTGAAFFLAGLLASVGLRDLAKKAWGPRDPGTLGTIDGFFVPRPPT